MAWNSLWSIFSQVPTTPRDGQQSTEVQTPREPSSVTQEAGSGDATTEGPADPSEVKDDGEQASKPAPEAEGQVTAAEVRGNIVCCWLP